MAMSYEGVKQGVLGVKSLVYKARRRERKKTNHKQEQNWKHGKKANTTKSMNDFLFCNNVELKTNPLNKDGKKRKHYKSGEASETSVKFNYLNAG